MKKRLEALIFESYRPSDEGLGIYRIAYSAVVLALLFPDFLWIRELPDSFFAPPLGPMRLLSDIPPTWALAGLEGALALALVALLFGWHTTAASWTLAVSATLGYGLAFSFGKIDHGLVIFWLAPLAAAAGWGRSRSLDARAGRSAAARAWPISLFAWLLALMMFSSALPKLVSGYLSPTSQAIQAVMLRQFHVHDRTEFLARTAIGIDSRFLWEVVDWSIVILEAAFIVAWLSPKTMRLACALAILFHFGVFLTANISFLGNVIAYGVFFALLVPNRDRPRALPARAAGGAVLVAALSLALVPLRAGPGVLLASLLTERPGLVLGALSLGSAALLATIYLARSAMNFFGPAPTADRGV